MEEIDGDGKPQLRLLIHPSIGPVDPLDVSNVFFQTIGGGSGLEQIMALQWRIGEYLCVERKVPQVTPSGKILHLWSETTEPLAGAHD